MSWHEGVKTFVCVWVEWESQGKVNDAGSMNNKQNIEMRLLWETKHVGRSLVGQLMTVSQLAVRSSEWEICSLHPRWRILKGTDYERVIHAKWPDINVGKSQYGKLSQLEFGSRDCNIEGRNESERCVLESCKVEDCDCLKESVEFSWDGRAKCIGAFYIVRSLVAMDARLSGTWL